MQVNKLINIHDASSFKYFNIVWSSGLSLIILGNKKLLLFVCSNISKINCFRLVSWIENDIISSSSSYFENYFLISTIKARISINCNYFELSWMIRALSLSTLLIFINNISMSWRVSILKIFYKISFWDLYLSKIHSGNPL